MGVPPDDAPNALLHSGTQRKGKDFSSDVSSNAVSVWHQMQNFLENYGCGCVWAVPENKQAFLIFGFGLADPTPKLTNSLVRRRLLN